MDFVCDHYPVQSIKGSEGERRAMSGTQVIHIKRPDQKTPKQFNKYPFQCWTRCDPGILSNVLLVVSHGEVCHSIFVNDSVVTVTVFSSVIIKSPDTGVMVLSMVKSQDFHRCLLLFMTGSDSNNRIINITWNKAGTRDMAGYPWATHFLTGCDSISAFKGKGNTKPLGLSLRLSVRHVWPLAVVGKSLMTFFLM